MENPWLNLRDSSPFVLECDREFIDCYEPYSLGNTSIVTTSLPQPYIGNLETARVVFLALNPGHKDQDLTDHREVEFQRSIIRNLRHEHDDFPFYPLNPKFHATAAGGWWLKNTKKLREATKLSAEELATKIMVIEWFPYHSISFSMSKQIIHSQYYSFALTQKALDMGKLVIGMRSKAQWGKVDKRLELIPYLRNPRQCSISSGNMGHEPFEELKKRLQN